jgi:hypothetical protein
MIFSGSFFRSGWPWWVGAVLAAVVAGVWWGRMRADRDAPGAGVHVIALDPESRAGTGWIARRVGTARSFGPGKTLRVPEGARVLLVWPDGRSEEMAGPAKLPVPAVERRGEVKENFLSVPLAELLALEPLGSAVSVGDVRIVSPAGVTRFTNPVIDWIARPGVEYDLAVIDQADELAPPRVALRVRPPIRFDQLDGTLKRTLQRDRLYEALIREAGSESMLGRARFLVEREATAESLPTAPSDLLREAAAAMAKKPTRTGDAWGALEALPEDWRESELALRLRLRVAAELGLPDAFAQAKDAAGRIMP